MLKLRAPGMLDRQLRFAHLEEQERRKPVWVGDSYLIHTTKEDESDDNI